MGLLYLWRNTLINRPWWKILTPVWWLSDCQYSTQGHKPDVGIPRWFYCVSWISFALLLAATSVFIKISILWPHTCLASSKSCRLSIPEPEWWTTRTTPPNSVLVLDFIMNGASTVGLQATKDSWSSQHGQLL